MKPKIATLTLSWNRKNNLRTLLRCVGKQTYKPDMVIVVDNGSTDSTLDMLKSEFPSAVVYELGRNTGYATGYNIAFAKVPKNIDCVIVLDQDLTIDSDYIGKIVKKFETEPETTAIIAGDVEEIRIKTLAKPEAYTTAFHGSSFAYRNKYKSLMKYPEEFFAHTCEADLAARLLNKGLRILFFPAIKTYHERDSTKRGGFRIFLETRNIFWFYWRNAGFIDAVISSLAVIPVYYSKASKSEQIPAFIRGLAAAIGGLPYCLRTREVSPHVSYKDVEELRKITPFVRILTLGTLPRKRKISASKK